MSLLNKAFFVSVALIVVLFFTVTVDAATDNQPSCVSCVVPAPHP